MKADTLHTLITARALLDQAERHCASGDRYLATAGIIVLQDAVELILLAVLLERDVDEKHNIEKFSFDEMLSAVGKIGIRVPKSGKLKAMNKLRVTAKHYGEIMEPSTVVSHLNTAKFAIDEIILASMGKRLREIFLVELIGNVGSRPFLDEAIENLNSGAYFDCLVSARKAFYEEFEQQYCIYDYRIPVPPDQSPWARGFVWHGMKAPAYTRDSEWIAINVKSPHDFIQIDVDNWRAQAMEWGINTTMLYNIRVLSPAVVKLGKEWHISTQIALESIELQRENAPIVLDWVIEAIRRKNEHNRSSKGLKFECDYLLDYEYIGSPILEKATYESKLVGVVREGDVVTVFQKMDGMLVGEKYYSVFARTAEGEMILGFVKVRPNAGLAQAKAGSWLG